MFAAAWSCREKQAKEPSEYRYPLINLRCIQQEGTIQLNEADIYAKQKRTAEEKSTSRKAEISLSALQHPIQQF